MKTEGFPHPLFLQNYREGWWESTEQTQRGSEILHFSRLISKKRFHTPPLNYEKNPHPSIPTWEHVPLATKMPLVWSSHLSRKVLQTPWHTSQKFISSARCLLCISFKSSLPVVHTMPCAPCRTTGTSNPGRLDFCDRTALLGGSGGGAAGNVLYTVTFQCFPIRFSPTVLKWGPDPLFSCNPRTLYFSGLWLG